MVDVKALGLPHVLELWLCVSKVSLPVKYWCSIIFFHYIVVDVKALGLPHVLELWLGVSKVSLPVKYWCSIIFFHYIVVDVKTLGLPHVLELWLGVSKVSPPVKYWCSIIFVLVSVEFLGYCTTITNILPPSLFAHNTRDKTVLSVCMNVTVYSMHLYVGIVCLYKCQCLQNASLSRYCLSV